jgi:hypothetical protein
LTRAAGDEHVCRKGVLYMMDTDMVHRTEWVRGAVALVVVVVVVALVVHGGHQSIGDAGGRRRVHAPCTSHTSART